MKHGSYFVTQEQISLGAKRHTSGGWVALVSAYMWHNALEYATNTFYNKIESHRIKKKKKSMILQKHIQKTVRR